MKIKAPQLTIHHLATLIATVLLIAVTTTHVFSKSIIDTNSKTTVTTKDNPAPESNKPKAQLDAKQLANLHLFGKQVIAKQATKPKIQPITNIEPENLPKSSIKLDIKGLFSHQDKTKGHAVIADKSGQDKSYKVGDKVSGNITLHAIHKDYAVIKNGSRLERLELPDVELSGGNALLANRNNLRARQKRLADSKQRNAKANEAVQ